MAFYQGISQRTVPGYHRLLPFRGFGDAGIPALLQAPGTPGGGTIDGQLAPGLGLDMTGVEWQAPPFPGAMPVVNADTGGPTQGNAPDLLARPAESETPWLLIAGLGYLVYAFRK